MSRQPRASGYFRTGYGQDLALVGTRLERVGLGVLAVALLAFPFFASPFQLDLACQVFLACVGALSLMLLTGYAGQISLGHAGLMAAGAFTVGILFREANAPFWITLPAAALVGGAARRHLRTAVAAAARALSRGQHARAAFRRDLPRRRVRIARGFSTGIVIDPPKLGGVAITDGRAWYFILLAAAAATLLICLNLLRAPHRPRLARDPLARDRRRGARHRHRRLQAARLRHQLGDHRGRRRAVRLLPRLRLGRGVLAVPHHPVSRHGHHRRHGLAARRAARRRFRHAVSLHRSRSACSLCRARSAMPACCSR